MGLACPLESFATNFLYDGNGRRVQETTNNHPKTFYHDGLNLILETQEKEVTSYTTNLNIDEVLSLSKGKSHKKGFKFENKHTGFFHTDHLNSTKLITDKKGKVKNRFDYMPFGEVKELPPFDSKYKTDVTYTGRERVADTGLYYYRNRYYMPETGRFLSKDLVFNLNRYAYVENNPIRFIDPLGLEIEKSVQKQFDKLRNAGGIVKTLIELVEERSKKGLLDVGITDVSLLMNQSEGKGEQRAVFGLKSHTLNELKNDGPQYNKFRTIGYATKEDISKYYKVNTLKNKPATFKATIFIDDKISNSPISLMTALAHEFQHIIDFEEKNDIRAAQRIADNTGPFQARAQARAGQIANYFKPPNIITNFSISTGKSYYKSVGNISKDIIADWWIKTFNIDDTPFIMGPLDVFKEIGSQLQILEEKQESCSY